MVSFTGTAQGLMQCPIKGGTPYFTAVQFWMLRRALELQCKGQKHFPPQFWKQLHLAAIAEGPDLRVAAKAVEKEPHQSPDMTKCSLPQLNSYVTRTLVGQLLVQSAQTTSSFKPFGWHLYLCQHHMGHRTWHHLAIIVWAISFGISIAIIGCIGLTSASHLYWHHCMTSLKPSSK